MPWVSMVGQVAQKPPFAGNRDLACQSGNPDWWFADTNRSPAGKYHVEQAKRLCRQCPQRWPCLDWALETRQQFGILGAAAARERRNMQPR